jgi:hypothetical protein
MIVVVVLFRLRDLGRETIARSTMDTGPGLVPLIQLGAVEPNPRPDQPARQLLSIVSDPVAFLDGACRRCPAGLATPTKPLETGVQPSNEAPWRGDSRGVFWGTSAGIGGVWGIQFFRPLVDLLPGMAMQRCDLWKLDGHLRPFSPSWILPIVAKKDPLSNAANSIFDSNPIADPGVDRLTPVR